jgi:hypothetical protein
MPTVRHPCVSGQFTCSRGMDCDGKDRDSTKVVGYLVRASPLSASDERAKKAVQ